MKYVIYLLTLLPVYQLLSVGQEIDPYDAALYITGLWGTIWFSLTLVIGPVSRKFKLRSALMMKQPMGLSVFTWFMLHFVFYLGFNQNTVGLALEDVLTKAIPATRRCLSGHPISSSGYFYTRNDP